MRKLSLFLLLVLLADYSSSAQNKTKNIIIVTIDGFRWQDVFRGADTAIANNKEYNDNPEGIKLRFLADSFSRRRKALLPFLWSAFAEKGQIYGNRDVGNYAELTNPYRISAPGYSEIFTGYSDSVVNSNNKVYNPNTNVLEYLNKQEGFKGKVIAFSSWDVFPYILNDKRSGFIVNSGISNLIIDDMSDRLKLLNELQHQVPGFVSEEIRLDALTYQLGKQYMIDHKPRVVYLAFDETDDLAHMGNYKFYLQQAYKTDAMLANLWNYLQSDPFYKDQTTMIITSDHGRGEFPLRNWKHHGSDVKGDEQVWVAVMGPDTPAKGEIKTRSKIYLKQIAQTMSELLGFDFKSWAGHDVGESIKSVTKK